MPRYTANFDLNGDMTIEFEADDEEEAYSLVEDDSFLREHMTDLDPYIQIDRKSGPTVVGGDDA